MAHASAVSAPTTHQSKSTTAAWKVTVPGNGVSLECSPEDIVRVQSLAGSTFAALQPWLLAKSSFRYDMRTRRQGPLLLQLTRLSPAYCYQSLLDQTDETPVASMPFVGKPR